MPRRPRSSTSVTTPVIWRVRCGTDGRTSCGSSRASGHSSTQPRMPRAGLPDPGRLETFERCKIDWSERERNIGVYTLHADLLRLRREDRVLGIGAQRRHRRRRPGSGGPGTPLLRQGRRRASQRPALAGQSRARPRTARSYRSRCWLHPKDVSGRRCSRATTRGMGAAGQGQSRPRRGGMYPAMRRPPPSPAGIDDHRSREARWTPNDDRWHSIRDEHDRNH